MGLDVDAFEKMTRIKDLRKGRSEDPDDEIGIFVNPDFPDQADEICNGIYRVEGERLSFPLGSYTQYNDWRNELSKITLGIPAERIWIGTSEGPMKGPFCELINFSDCEGVFGPKTSLKLYQDFKDHELEFAMKSKDAHDCLIYVKFMRAFLIASKGGAVQFS